MSKFDEIAEFLYLYACLNPDSPEFLESKLLEIREKEKTGVLFDKVLSSLLLNFADVQDFFSEELCKLYIDNPDNL